MCSSHIVSFVDNVTKFIKSKMYFIARKLHSLICQSQGHANSNETKHKAQAEELLTNSEDADNHDDQTSAGE